MKESKTEIVKLPEVVVPALMQDVEKHLVEVRGERVLLDSFVAQLYGVETKRINEAVKNNLAKFPDGYMYHLEKEELASLRSKFSTTNISNKSRVMPTVFTEKGLYMLATILKSERATAATVAIIETFAAVRSLKRELVELHKETDPNVQKSKMEHFGKVLTDIVMPDLETTETESTLELNFFIGKLTHTIKRTKHKPEK